MSATVRLSDRCTLLIPVAPERLDFPPAATFDGVAMVRKAEHHITVFGFDIGKVLGAAMKTVPALRPALDALIDAADFSWTLPASPQLYRLHRDKPRDLQTVVVLVDAPGIAAFFASCERLAEIASGAVLPEWDAPPPHITIYTSDPAGKDGIGLRRPSDLEQAARRGDASETTGLRAHRVANGAL